VTLPARRQDPEAMADTIELSAEFTDRLGPTESVRAVLSGPGITLVATEFRVLTEDSHIPLTEVVSVATAGNSLSGGALSIRAEHLELRCTGVPFEQAQRFAAAVRSGLARVQAAAWMPIQRGN
jgi:hypothetical protein